MRTRFPALAISVVALLAGCDSRRVLVEQFDNGPVGGPRGASEGYFWVSESDDPTLGKSWKRIDPATLTEEQRKRIRN